MEDGGLTGVGADEKVVPESEVKALKDRIRSLERMLGRKTEEVEILKEAVNIGRKKN
jgi:transposase